MKKLTILLNPHVGGTLFRIGSMLLLALAMSSQILAQGVITNGSPEWIGGNGKLYTVGAKVGINTNSPFRGLHLHGAGHRYLRTTSTGGDEFHTFAAGLELQRKLDNGQTIMWDIVNQGTFKVRRNIWALFQIDENEAQFGVQTKRTTLNIWGKSTGSSGGELNEGTLALRNHISGGYQTMRLDGNQIETATEMHLNFISDQNVALVHGGGAVKINTDDDEAKLNVDSDNYHMKMINGNNKWRVGASNGDWTVGDGKLVFSNTQASGDATMVLTAQGRVGIGMITPSHTLDVKGSTRTTTLKITGGADLAEPFEVSGESKIEAGMIVAIDPANAGELKVATSAYDKTVAGIVSGAGDIQPGMVMGQDGSIASGEHPVALTGRVYAKVDASYGAIQPGDLLTTSDTPGHAMRVSDSSQAQGAIIGKAMTALEEGQGLVLVLVSLQ
ncbi:MAG: hypothetical protein WBA23_10665 [Tunicatimonas sp.]|uniref:hypothetical protein n=1 Tax=Tunicatimonas sp. TaxID=1940096 RepID=UPI003C71B3FC